MSASLVEHVSAQITVDGCVCVSGGICQCCDHGGWVCLCLWWNMSVLCPLWMGVSVSLVEHVSALITVDLYVCEWVYLCLWWNMSVL